MTAQALNHDTQALRAYIEAKKRDVRAAEQRYDIPAAAAELHALTLPLLAPKSDVFPASWKRLYADVFYRDVARFLLGFVTVHLEICFSPQQRADTIDAFFDPRCVPATNVLDALATTLASTSRVTEAAAADRDDAHATIAQCVRLLERALDADALDDVVTAMLAAEDQTPDGRGVVAYQPLVASLCALPDVVYNRCERAAPPCFAPRRYYARLGTSLFRALLTHCSSSASASQRSTPSSAVFRLVVDKLARIGQTRAVVQSWLAPTSRLYDPQAANVHALLLASVPESCHEHVLLELAVPLASESVAVAQAASVRSPRYRLVSLLPQRVAASTQFQYVVAHKLVLERPIADLFFLRALIDALAAASQDDGDPDPNAGTNDTLAPLAAVFDAVVARWSHRAFVAAADYALDASASFFVRYALAQLALLSTFARDCARRDWVAQLCAGVQRRMSHSLARSRVLGMRVGESVARVLTPEKPLNFELPESDVDPLVVFGSNAFDGAAAAPASSSGSDVDDVATDAVEAANRSNSRRRTARRRPKATPFTLDPDSVLDSDVDVSDTDASHDSDEDVDNDDSASDADSDVSLAAYDLADDEQDLGAKRPMYLRDLVTALSADDARETTEVALADAEALLRRLPRDVHENAVAVATALLRLEDKYDTPNFTVQRARALAAACVVSPQHVAPFLQRQALEREQLLQSRLDALEALAAAAQELAQVGAFRPARATSLLTEDINTVDNTVNNTVNNTVSTVGNTVDDLNTRTAQALKTRRWGYRRDPLAVPRRNAFADHALAFFSPLLAGYVAYVRTHSSSSDSVNDSLAVVTTGSSSSATHRLDMDDSGATGVSEVESVFLAHLLHTLATLVECAGHAPAAIAMAHGLLAFAWRERTSRVAAVRRQVIFSVSRVLLVVPPVVLRQELSELVVEVAAWLQRVQQQDPDGGCRDGARLLLASGALPMLALN